MKLGQEYRVTRRKNNGELTSSTFRVDEVNPLLGTVGWIFAISLFFVVIFVQEAITGEDAKREQESNLQAAESQRQIDAISAEYKALK